MATLFLDFDGVLHPHAAYHVPGRGIILQTDELPDEMSGVRLFGFVHHLEAILADIEDVQIVLSTSWVPMVGYRRTLSRLPDAIRQRVVGSTFHSTKTPDWWHQTRYQQIRQHVGFNRMVETEWVALDDDVRGWPAHRLGQLVRCDEVTGLSDSTTRSALRDALLRISGASQKPAGSRS